MQVAVQHLAVSEYLEPGNRQTLRYAPGSIADSEGQAPLPAHCVINPGRVANAIREVRDTVRRLTDIAAHGEMRGALDVSDVARRLASAILPEAGFVGLIGPDMNPQFDLAGDIGGEVPWEVLEERFALCRCGEQPRHQLLAADAAPERCVKCHKVMEEAGGKLALQRHLTHLVRYSRRSPLGQGKDFLMVIDPTGDLLTGDADPTGTCREHVTRLEAMLTTAGFNVNVVRRKFATLDKVETALKSPKLVGMYYFGHGKPPENRRPGSLVLSDGELRADEIEMLDTTPRTVFLNACWGGQSTARWDLDNRANSVGEALARGGRKVVIGSLFPVVNIQAARTAVLFFEQALAGQSLAEALQLCRRDSYERYAAGEADVGWMAYRYFGDPNQSLPKPVAEVAVIPVGEQAEPPSIFDENERLVADQFGFDFRGVLLRAAGRRNRQQRQLVTLHDMFAGLLRVGQLTRACWRERGRDADDDYESLRDFPDPETSPAVEPAEPDDAEQDHAAKLMSFLAKWLVRQRAEFSPQALALLAQASRVAAEAGRVEGEGRITERDVLQAVCRLESKAESKLPVLDTQEVERWLQSFDRQKMIDHNGCIRLDQLQPDARRIVERSHELAQQRGQSSIGSRILLAAFLSDSEGIAARLCRQADANGAMIRLMLIAITKGETPTEFPLSLEVCKRVVLPMLKEAGLNHGEASPDLISEEELFRAFCRVAPVELRKHVLAPQISHEKTMVNNPFHLDLDRLAKLSLEPLQESIVAEAESVLPTVAPAPPTPTLPVRPLPAPMSSEPVVSPPAEKQVTVSHPLDASGQLALVAAMEFAHSQGRSDIRSAHLFAGMLCVEGGHLVGLFQRKGIAIGKAIAAALLTMRSQVPDNPNPAPGPIQVSSNVAKWLKSAALAAQQNGDKQIGERHLTDILLTAPSAVVSYILKHLGADSLEGEVQRPSANETSAPAVTLGARGWDLTALARRGSLPELAIRPRLLGLFAKLLARSPAARIALVGAPGVGKSSLVASLARTIVDEVCEPALRDCRVVQLSAAELSGQGRFCTEGLQRLQHVLGTVGDDVILLLDDLVPGLFLPQDWDQLDWKCCAGRVVVALESNSAVWQVGGLADFEILNVPAASQVECEQILMSVRLSLQSRFGVQISDDALLAAGELARGGTLPGSAIELLEQGCITLLQAGKETGILTSKQLKALAAP